MPETSNSPTLDLAIDLVSRDSVTPKDKGCQDLMIGHGDLTSQYLPSTLATFDNATGHPQVNLLTIAVQPAPQLIGSVQTNNTHHRLPCMRIQNRGSDD